MGKAAAAHADEGKPDAGQPGSLEAPMYMEPEGRGDAWAPDFQRLSPAGISRACPGRTFPAAAAPAASPRDLRNCLRDEKIDMI